MMDQRWMIEELTGLEEHLAFEAGAEDGELAAARAEAERERRLEVLWLEDERLEFERAWLAQQADPMRAVCSSGRDRGFEPRCSMPSGDDSPF